jgi:nitrite reductase/ring-hydroxylating ferredoxin subunit
MKSIIALALVGSAAAFAPSTKGHVSSYLFFSTLTFHYPAADHSIGSHSVENETWIHQVATALNAKTAAPKLMYVPCISTDDLPSPGSATSGVAGGLAICIAVDQKGAVYALGDKCPPVNQPLSFGKVGTDGTISDPVLGTKFSLKTGEVVSWCPSGLGKLVGGLFDPVGVPTYPVKAKGKVVEVQVDVNYKANFEANYWSGVLDAQGKANGKYY